MHVTKQTLLRNAQLLSKDLIPSWGGQQCFHFEIFDGQENPFQGTSLSEIREKLRRENFSIENGRKLLHPAKSQKTLFQHILLNNCRKNP